MTRASDPHDLRRSLDDLANRSGRFLATWAFHRDLRLASLASIGWLLAVPVILLVVQTSLVLVGRAPLASPVWVWALASLAGPVLFIAVRVALLSKDRQHDRRACLGVYDRQVDSKDRLVTADEFLAAVTPVAGERATDHFKAAAIEDAANTVAQALKTPLEPRPLPAWSAPPRSWVVVPAAIALVFAAMWLGRLANTIRATSTPDAVTAAVDLDTLPAKIVASLLDLRPNAPKPERQVARDPSAPNNTQSSPDTSPRTTKTDQDADGQSHTGGQANSRSSSQAQSSSGTPSNQQTPSRPLEEDPAQESQKASAMPPKKTDGKKLPQQATSATSGQGQSKSSSSDSTAIPATDQPDRAGANKDDGPDEAGIQDEVEEEKTAGVERPSLRKNKPPVDRNLSPRPTGDQPDPNANGRSGPGGRKKTRGVPAMILGVPTPDRIQGMTNPGRSKVTQETSTPVEEPQSALTAEERRARDAAFGHIEHPLLLPWMQNLVEKYFLQLRGKTAPPPPPAKDNR